MPAIVLTGGPSEAARFRGRELGVGTDLWHYTNEVRAGRMSMDDYRELEAALIPSNVHCNEMGTASTMIADPFHAGGVAAVLGDVRDLVDLDALTVSGRALGEGLAGRQSYDADVLGTLAAPPGGTGALAVLRGSLAPRVAIIKRSATTERLLRHRGPAVVFEGIEDVAARIDDPALAIVADSVLILRDVGPRGAPGMPERGMVPIPSRLVAAGLEDMVPVSDARMCGTPFGTVALHVAPEAAVGGPLAIVRDGHPVVLDVEAGVPDLDSPEPERQARLAAFESRPAMARLPAGLFSGWIGGW